MTTTAYAWAPITKVEDQDDGTVLVYGPATDTTLDRDGQRMDQKWLDKAMPQWMAEGGNVREQHDPRRAVGVAVGLHKDDGSGAWMLTSRVVDPVAVTKVKAGVLKGYSIGVKDPHITFGKAEAPNGLIDGGVICETSLADRPANPTTYFTIAKADDSGALVAVEDPELVEEVEPDDEGAEPDLDKAISAGARAQMASSGIAMPNGDFPIPDEGHLRSAIGHLGNYDGNRAEAKAHIITRARALNLVNLLPDEWGITKADEILAEVRQAVPAVLTKADASDIADAQEAIACVGRLICSEATSLAAGQLEDADQIACLLDAVRALRYFISCEQAETPTTSGATDADSMSVSGGTYMAESTKADETQAEDTTTAPDLTKVDMAAVSDIVKAAVAEANKTSEGRFAAIEAQLAKALEMPVAGGPVGARTASDTAAARAKDANHLRAQAADLIAKAEALRADDPILSLGYREKAADLLAKADA